MRVSFDGRCCGCDRTEPEVSMVVGGLGTTHVQVGEWAEIELLFCADCIRTLRENFGSVIDCESPDRIRKEAVDHSARLTNQTCTFCERSSKEAKGIFRAYEVYRVGEDELMRVNQPLDLVYLQALEKKGRANRREGEICICSVCVQSAAGD